MSQFLGCLRHKLVKNGICCLSHPRIEYCRFGRPVGYRHFGQPAAQTHPHLLSNGEVTPGITQEEFCQRRHRLMDRIASSLKPDHNAGAHVVIVPGACKQYMSHDIPYPFRQNTDFLYLCGFMEPNSLLLLESTGSAKLPQHKATLFVPKRDQHTEMWEGARSGVDGAVSLTAVDEAYNLDEVGAYLQKVLNKNKDVSLWYDHQKPVLQDFHDRYMKNVIKDNNVADVKPIQQIVQSLRLTKSPAEIQLLKTSCSIASSSFKKVMGSSRPNIAESFLHARMEYECRLQGASYLAYPPVVAGGSRACTIHYIHNDQLVHDGEMVLMDAGCEYAGYNSDITRTWPVSGTFTPVQRELYEAVLEVQESCVRLVSSRLPLDVMFMAMLKLIGEQLLRLRIVKQSSSPDDLFKAARQFCPHHLSHWLGMDIHDVDTQSRSINLQPGMVLTIEPGIYIPHTRQDVPLEFRGLAIRIEDDVVVTEEGVYNLTSSCPKSVQDIENAVKTQGTEQDSS